VGKSKIAISIIGVPKDWYVCYTVVTTISKGITWIGYRTNDDLLSSMMNLYHEFLEYFERINQMYGDTYVRIYTFSGDYYFYNFLNSKVKLTDIGLYILGSKRCRETTK
jgi:hypothetical protein